MLRSMRWWDLAAVCDIERRVFPTTAWSQEAFWSELARVGVDRWYAVVEDQGRVCGYAGLWLAPPEADVQTLAVAPEAQGRGWGGALLAELLDTARRTGCRRISLEVRADNPAARSLYAAAGFDQVRTRPRYYPDLADAIVMGREL